MLNNNITGNNEEEKKNVKKEKNIQKEQKPKKYKFENINLDDIKLFSLGKTYKYSLKSAYIHLYYKGEKIRFQSPVLFIPYNVRVKEVLNKNYKNYYLKQILLIKN